MSSEASEPPSSTGPSSAAAQPAASPWEPLATPIFRALWIAGLASNVGTWVNEVGASWLMTSLAPTPLWVSLVPAASSLPVVLFALPAGALADVVDRRRVLLAAQGWMLASAALLAAVTLLGAASPPALLALTFCLGLGAAFTAPAWQAAIPELVRGDQLREAITLGSLSINLARAVGPALGGLVVARFGPGAAFALNAVSFVGVLVVFARWRRPAPGSPLPAERFFAALRTGLQYVRHSPQMRRVIARAVAFSVPASALWALLPLYTRTELGRGAGFYGVLVGVMGSGAVSGALALPWLRRRLPGDRLIRAAPVVFGAALATVGLSSSPWPVAVAMAFAGGAWLTQLSTLQTTAQQTLPGWVRARALSVYLLVFFAGFAFGAALWGAVAELVGLPAAFLVAAGAMTVDLALGFRLRLLAGGPPPDVAPSRHWPAPSLAIDRVGPRQPVAVTLEYRVEPGRMEEFGRAMAAVRQVRLRDGALQWGLFQDAADPTRVIEMFLSESWVDHLRQHERVTVADRGVLEVPRRLAGGGEPRVAHLVRVTLPEAEG